MNSNVKITGLLRVACLAFLASATARADYPATVLSQAPVGYWRLNETAAPPAPAPAANLGGLGAQANGEYLLEATRGVPGALAGSSDTATRFANPAMDVAFVGSKVDVPFIAQLNPQGAFSVEVWAKPVSAVSDVFCVAASIDSDTALGPNPRAGWIIYQTAANQWQFRMGALEGYTDGGAVLGGTVTPGAWHHLVGVYDGTRAHLYVNGVEVASRELAFVANTQRPLRIGGTTFTGSGGTFAGNRGFHGDIDEVAFYGAALDATAIKAHYDTGTTDGNAYPGLVQAANPLGYWRLGEPGNPAAENLGTLGVAGNGTYLYPAKPGQPGPRPTAFPGFAGDNVACEFDGTTGYVNLPALNLGTNTVTITAWIKPNGLQPANAGIVFCRAGTTAAGLKFDTADPNGLSYNWNDEAAAYNFKSSLAVPADQWSFVAMIVQPDIATLCLHDGTTFNTAVNYDARHGVQGFDGPTRLGSDSGDAALAFNGAIDEVAIFNRALGVGEVYSQYADAVGGMQPTIFGQPQVPTGTLYTGDSLTLTVDAGGSTPLTYQWRRNGTAISGATSPTFTKASLALADAGNYDVVISNGVGSVTSQPLTIAIENLTTPSIVSQPVGRSVYPGGTVVLAVEATGGALAYQWQKDGSDIPDATSATYTLDPAAAADAGDYRVRVSNRVGSLTSDIATVAVTVPVAGSYEAAIVADGPEAWYRLDEEPWSLELRDAMGRHDGLYADTYTLGVPGAVRGGNTALALDGSGYAEVPYDPILNSRDFTFECWAKTTVLDSTLCPMSSRASTKGGYFYTRNGEWVGGVSDGGANFYVPSGVPDALMQSDRWVHLVLSYGKASDGIDYGMRIFVNGKTGGTEYADFDRNTSGPLLIGARGVSAPGGGAPGVRDWLFQGVIDEVAVYTKSLTEEEVLAHYTIGLYGSDTKPVFITQPLSGAVLPGASYSFTPQVEGSAGITYQWQKDGAPLNSATNMTLTVTSAGPADGGVYQLIATNPAGTTSSDSVTLSVLVQPTGCNLTNGDLVLHLKFEDDYQDASGRNNHGTPRGTPTFVAGAIGDKALHYNTVTDTTVDPAVVTAAHYVSLGKPADLQFGTSQDFSISFWIRLPQGALPGDLPFFCNAENAYTNPGYTFAPSYQAGGWSWGLGSVGVYGPDDTINDGQWHHLVHTFDRTGNAITYLDGARVDVRSAGAQNLDTDLDTSIGQDPTGIYPEAGEADIDDLGVWRRVLTPEEALCIYAVGLQGVSFDTPAAPRLTLTYNGSQVLLSWPSGTLQEADAVTGPWTDVAGANAPAYTVTPTAAKKFYRVKL